MPLLENEPEEGCCYCTPCDLESDCPEDGPEHESVMCCLCGEWACMCSVGHTVSEWFGGNDLL